MLIRVCDMCGEETGEKYYNVAINEEYYNVPINAATRCFVKNNIHYSLCKKCKNKINKYIHYERLLHKENKKTNKRYEEKECKRE